MQFQFHARFTPEALNWKFVTRMIGWFSEVMLLKVSIFSLGGGEAPLLEMVAYAGYTFTGMCWEDHFDPVPTDVLPQQHLRNLAFLKALL